jgi:hypothetical protein
MAATSSDIKRWRLDAEDAEGDDLEDQIAWLKTQRTLYSDKVKAGDWEITADSSEGSSTQGRRGVSDRDNHDAIVGAIDQIKGELGTGGKSRGALLGFRINDITG